VRETVVQFPAKSYRNNDNLSTQLESKIDETRALSSRSAYAKHKNSVA